MLLNLKIFNHIKHNYHKSSKVVFNVVVCNLNQFRDKTSTMVPKPSKLTINCLCESYLFEFEAHLGQNFK